MSKPLVIVESPAKAKTIASFLGNHYVVEASIGHVRDLPRNAADVPPAMKKKVPWARLGVDIDHDFKPFYIVPDEKKEQIKKLKALLKNASELYLATDEDREGESISWHLLEVLEPKVPVKRMVFHEITRQAIEHAVQNSRGLNMPLVDAQETRRILDRLYGYEVSPVLWKKVLPQLSAGRVQSVAMRLIVERERDRMRFRTASYWDIEGAFPTEPKFGAHLVALDGKRVAQGRDFDEQGKPNKPDVRVLDEAAARGLADRLKDLPFNVRSVEEKPFRSSPKPPFMTSTLQQEGGRKLRMSAAQVMRVAQGLYERGYITYMRTDSTNLSEVALKAARDQVKELFGAEYLPEQPRIYAKKVKNAQEAHEAIRPAGEQFRTPEQLAVELRGDDLRLYEMIWKRTLASQMNDSNGQSVSVRLFAKTAQGEDAEFAASGRTVTFPGYLRAYVEGSDDPEAELDDRETLLPPLKVGDALPAAQLTPLGHNTSPPARYTEASLVKKLEELSVGRPSTYASIMSTIQQRNYAWKKSSALIPTWTAFAVTNLMEKHFPDLVDYAFTAHLEDDLDKIAEQQMERVPWLKRFYFGEGKGESKLVGLKEQVSSRLGEIDAAQINSIPLGNDPNGVPVVVKPGKYGPYVRRGEDTASVPDDLAPDELTLEKALQLLAAPKGTEPIGVDPKTNLPVFVKAGRFGPYVQLGNADTLPKDQKPKTASLFKTMTPDKVTLADALQLLTIPRVIGVDPADNQEVVAYNGKFGPYIKKGKESRNLGVEAEPKLLTMDLTEALHILAQPRQFRGRGTPKPPLKELGPDPVSGKNMVVKEGRFGLYVTDGETNASLRRGDTLEELTFHRAVELLAERRAAAPSPKARRKAAKAAKAAKVKATKAKAEAKPANGAKASAAKPKAKAKDKPAAQAKGKSKASSKAAKEPKSKSKSKAKADLKLVDVDKMKTEEKKEPPEKSA
jgi:DNA topoisomerase-1